MRGQLRRRHERRTLAPPSPKGRPPSKPTHAKGHGEGAPRRGRRRTVRGACARRGAACRRLPDEPARRHQEVVPAPADLGGSLVPMSRLTELGLFDKETLEGLVLGFRRAAGDPRALRRLLDQAEEPPLPVARKQALSAELARFRALNAPPIVIENCRRELAPRALLRERIRRGESLAEWEILPLALRGKKPIPDGAYSFITWVADHEARRRGPTPEMSDGWTHSFSATDPAVREAMFGARALEIGGVATLGADRGWVHDVPALPGVRRFFEGLLAAAPPPLDDYRRWYPHLHSMEFCTVDDAQVPEDGPLGWKYASELAVAARAIRAMIAVLHNAARRGWVVQIWWE